MTLCPNCKKEMPVDAKFCGICGAKLPRKSKQMLDFFDLKALKSSFHPWLLYKDIKKTSTQK